MALSAAVQHHPGRAELLPPLLAALEPLRPDVAADPDPSGAPAAWRAYRVALERTPPWATHRLIVQDDAVPCAGFAAAAAAAVEQVPDALLAFCVCGSATAATTAIRQALAAGRQLVRIPFSYLPVVATSWPAAAIGPALEWVDEQGWPPTFTDDGIGGRVAKHFRLEVVATAPSLVEHRDEVASIVRIHVPKQRRHRMTSVPPPAGFDGNAWAAALLEGGPLPGPRIARRLPSRAERFQGHRAPRR